MKNLIFINGTMGVGKTTISIELQKMLKKCIFLDGDWCWNSKPFIVSEKTKQMVVENIIFLLNNFLSCPDYENIVFCWVMHEQSIIDKILNSLVTNKGYRFKLITLLASKKVLRNRIEKDIQKGIRDDNALARSIERQQHYKLQQSFKIDVSEKTPDCIASIIFKELK